MGSEMAPPPVLRPPADRPRVGVLIPALNEAASIGRVIEALPVGWVDQVVVADNGSTDGTAAAARAAGATVVHEPERGYGAACLRGMAWFRSLPEAQRPDLLVFLDGDFSDYPQDLALLVGTLLETDSDLVLGSRVLGQREAGALLPQQRFGNWLATRLLRLIYGVRYTDLGPFRAIRWTQLEALGMRDRNYGWTVEMQLRAARAGLRIREVPVRYRKRIGQSKVSGTIRGSLRAGYKILWTIFRYGGDEI